MPFMTISLREKLAGEPVVGIEEATRVALAVVTGLEHARKCLPEFTHGDIKPENILFDEDGVARLADFGLASASTDFGLLTEPLAAGTHAYMAPELRRGDAHSSRSDVYALGMTLAEMLLPVSAMTATEASVGRGQRLLTALSAHTTLRQPLRELLLGMLDPDCRARPTLSECETGLARTLDAKPNAASTTTGRDQGQRYSELARLLHQLALYDDADRFAALAAELPLDEYHRNEMHLDRACRAVMRADSEQARVELALASPAKAEGPGAPDLEYRFTKALLASEEGNFELAVAEMRYLLELVPEDAANWYALGTFYEKESMWAEAAEAYEEAALRSVIPDFHARLVAMHLQLNDGARAQQCAERAIALNPTSGHCRAVRVMTYASRGRSNPSSDEDVAIALHDPDTPHLLLLWLRSNTRSRRT
jgi:hypothetical protein